MGFVCTKMRQIPMQACLHLSRFVHTPLCPPGPRGLLAPMSGRCACPWSGVCWCRQCFEGQLRHFALHGERGFASETSPARAADADNQQISRVISVCVPYQIKLLVSDHGVGFLMPQAKVVPTPAACNSSFSSRQFRAGFARHLVSRDATRILSAVTHPTCPAYRPPLPSSTNAVLTRPSRRRRLPSPRRCARGLVECNLCRGRQPRRSPAAACHRYQRHLAVSLERGLLFFLHAAR